MRIPTVNVFTLVITVVLSLCMASAALAKGPPGKVEVTAASPPEASQGQELDVIVSGSGFDAGSSVNYLVTGTTDNTQVTVDSVEYISPSELRTHIRVKGDASVNDYDIEVQSSTGRKGKGTTLFSVKLPETACTGFESKEPEIAFLGAAYTVGENEISDLFLASESGCDETLIAEAVNVENPQTHVAEHTVVWLRLSTLDGTGVVTWSDNGTQVGIRFNYDAAGNITLETGSPSIFYQPVTGREVWGSDARLSSSNEVELVMRERDRATNDRQLMTLNLDNNFSEILISGECPVLTPDGVCLEITWPAFWGEQGDEIYLNLIEKTPDGQIVYDNKQAIARMTLTNGEWGEPELLILNDGTLKIESISATGVLVMDYEEVLHSRNGKVRGIRRAFGAIHVSECESSLCSPLDGADLDMDRNGKGYLVITPEGKALVLDKNNQGPEWLIREYTDPFSGDTSRTLIEGVGTEFDTAH